MNNFIFETSSIFTNLADENIGKSNLQKFKFFSNIIGPPIFKHIKKKKEYNSVG